MEKRQAMMFLLEAFLIMLFLLIIGSGVVVSPFFGDINMIDEGQFGAWMSHMKRGEYLYKDTYAAYGPLYIYPLYLLSKLFGQSVFLIRVVYIVFNTFFAVIIARLVMREMGLRYRTQLFVVVLLLVVPGFGMRQAIGLLAILLCYTAYERGKIIHTVAAGCSLAIALLVSVEIGIFSSIVCAGYVFCKMIIADSLRTPLLKMAAMLLGFVCVLSLFWLWSDREGWFVAYTSSQIDDLQTYSGIGIPIGKGFPNVFALIPDSISVFAWAKFIVSKELLLYWQFLFYILSMFFFSAIIFLRTRTKKTTLAILIALYGLALSTILIGRYGHFPFTLSPVFILFGYFFDKLSKYIPKATRHYDTALAAMLTITLLLFTFRIILIYRPHFVKIPQAVEAVYVRKDSPPYVGPIFLSEDLKQPIRMLQAFIWNTTRSDENVFFLNNTPMYYLLVNRGNPSRFDLPEVINSKEKRMELIAALERDKTRYIIDDTTAWSVDGVSNSQRLPEIIDYIQRNYSQSRLGHFIIYTRQRIR